MNCINCNFKCSCTAIAWIVSAIIGVIAAFLQITAIITVAPVFLWSAFIQLAHIISCAIYFFLIFMLLTINDGTYGAAWITRYSP